MPGFIDVVSRDAYPEEGLPPGGSIIINQAPHYRGGGTHWVCAYRARDAPSVLYFDPFGQPPPSDVTLASWRQGCGVLRSDARWQQFKDTNCGPRSAAALHELSHAKNDVEAFRGLCNA